MPRRRLACTSITGMPSRSDNCFTAIFMPRLSATSVMLRAMTVGRSIARTWLTRYKFHRDCWHRRCTAPRRAPPNRPAGQAARRPPPSHPANAEPGCRCPADRSRRIAAQRNPCGRFSSRPLRLDNCRYVAALRQAPVNNVDLPVFRCRSERRSEFFGRLRCSCRSTDRTTFVPLPRGPPRSCAELNR